MDVNVITEAVVEMPSPGIEAIFSEHYDRIARVIARVIRDPARAEELAVEALLRWSRNGKTLDGAAGGLYRTAVRIALNELRRRTRQSRYERLFALVRKTPTPEEIYLVQEEQDRVRLVLSVLDTRQAELLLLRSHGLSYAELASALELNPASIGTFLSRSQQTFRKEYVRRYGTERE